MPHSIGFALSIRHRRGGRTCVSTRGWRRFHPPADDASARVGPTVCSACSSATRRRRPAEGPPRALRALGLVSMAAVLISTFVTDPKPGLHGDGPLVIVGHRRAARPACCSSVRRHEWFDGARFIGLALVGAASILFAAVQPDSAGYAGVYFVMAIGGIRLGRDAAIIVCGGTVVGIIVVGIARPREPGVHRRPAVQRRSRGSLIMRLIRRLGGAARRGRAARSRSCASRARRRPRRPSSASAAASRASCTTCSRTR